jgi:hypothetical protein
MNKKQAERIAIIGLVALLVGYGIYQTAYGIVIPTALQRTATDASYKWGFIQGKSEWGSCSDADGDCQTGLTDCQSPSYTVYNYTTGYYNAVPNSAPLSNHTACIDGYVNGWNHVCDHKIARSWPNNEIICPMTFGRAAMNTTDGSSSGHPNEISTTWHVDARAVWQNTTNDGQPMLQGKKFTQCFAANGIGNRCENSASIG